MSKTDPETPSYWSLHDNRYLGAPSARVHSDSSQADREVRSDVTIDHCWDADQRRTRTRNLMTVISWVVVWLGFCPKTKKKLKIVWNILSFNRDSQLRYGRKTKCLLISLNYARTAGVKPYWYRQYPEFKHYWLYHVRSLEISCFSHSVLVVSLGIFATRLFPSLHKIRSQLCTRSLQSCCMCVRAVRRNSFSENRINARTAIVPDNRFRQLVRAVFTGGLPVAYAPIQMITCSDFTRLMDFFFPPVAGGYAFFATLAASAWIASKSVFIRDR